VLKRPLTLVKLGPSDVQLIVVESGLFVSRRRSTIGDVDVR